MRHVGSKRDFWLKVQLLVFVILFSDHVIAEDEFRYIGLGFSKATYEDNFADVNLAGQDYTVKARADTDAFFIKAGMVGIRNIGTELGVLWGDGSNQQSKKIIITNSGDTAEIYAQTTRLIGYYLSYWLPVADSASLYGLMGGTIGSLNLRDASSGNVIAESKDSSFSYGFGLDLSGWNFEYMSYVEDKDLEGKLHNVSALSVGYLFRF